MICVTTDSACSEGGNIMEKPGNSLESVWKHGRRNKVQVKDSFQMIHDTIEILKFEREKRRIRLGALY